MLNRSEIKTRTEKIVCSQLGIEPEDLEESLDYMGCGSLDIMCILIEIEEEFNIKLQDELNEQWNSIMCIVNSVIKQLRIAPQADQSGINYRS